MGSGTSVLADLPREGYDYDSFEEVAGDLFSEELFDQNKVSKPFSTTNYVYYSNAYVHYDPCRTPMTSSAPRELSTYRKVRPGFFPAPLYLLL